jgi:uncharacterized protein (TIGR03435 family)
MRTACIVALLASSAAAQTRAPLAFEVASVKINPQFSQDNRATWRPSIETTPGSLTMRNVDLPMMVAWAYEVQPAQVAAPEGANAKRYDVLAKAGSPAAVEELRQMLQVLLAERFQLALHRESRTMDAMVIVLPKGGHKMTPSAAGAPSEEREDTDGTNVVRGSTMAELAGQMSRELGIAIVDMTGLQGRFDFTLNPRKYLSSLQSRLVAGGQPMREADAKVILMQDVIAGELGLRLEARKTAVDVVVIDRAEKAPVSN